MTKLIATLDKAKPTYLGFYKIQKDLRACKMIKCNDCDTWKYFSNELRTFEDRKPCNEKTCKIGHVHNLQNMVIFSNPTFTDDLKDDGFDLVDGVCMKCFMNHGHGGY